MVKLVNVDEMRAIESAADAAGVSYAQMMETAGKAIFERAKHIASTHLEIGVEALRVVVLVGPGNNGGDGLVAARLLAEAGATVGAYLAKPRTDENLNRARHAGVSLIENDVKALRALVAGADILLDALLGTGIKLPLRNEICDILRHTRIAIEGRQGQSAGMLPAFFAPDVVSPIAPENRPHIIAVDIPSGMDADNGEIDPLALKADETVTFEAAKPGHVLFPGADYTGQLWIAPLNLPEGLRERESIRRTLVDAQTVRQLLPKRPLNANKGTFGKALVLGGSSSYIGAPGLSALAAYRVGAGLVSVAAPERIVTALASQMLEVTWLPLPLPEKTPPDEDALSNAAASLAYTQLPNYTAMLIGPGMGRALNVYALIEKLLSHGGYIPPLVIDADGLNMLATMDELWPLLPARTILTPHPGEMARLAKIRSEEDRTGAKTVQANRLTLARDKAAAWNCIVVLKGAYTIIADPDGRVAVLPFAEPALASAGTGDVLAGMIAGLLAQGLDPFDAAVVGGYVHAYAGRLAAQFAGTRAAVIAGDVLAAIPAALAEFEAEL